MSRMSTPSSKTRPFVHVVEAHQERKECRLPCPGGPDEGNFVASRNMETYVPENGIALHVVEVDSFETNIAGGGDGRPAAGSVHNLGFHVHQLKDPGPGRHGALQGTVLHGEIHYRLEEPLYVEGECD